MASRWVGYCAVVTEGLAEGGSTRAEARLLGEAASRNRIRLARVAIDRGPAASTIFTRRPALSQALRDVRADEGLEGILVLKLDRVLRDARDLVPFARRFALVRLLAVEEQLDTTSPSGQVLLSLINDLSRRRRESASRSHSEVVKQGRSRSRFTPFGYRTADGATEARAGDRRGLVEHAEEKAVLEAMRSLRAAGLGARRIASRLNASAQRNPRSGREWRPSAVQSILRTDARRARALGPSRSTPSTGP